MFDRFRRTIALLKKSLGLIAIAACVFSPVATHAELFTIDYEYWPNTNNFYVYDTFIFSPYADVDLTDGHRLGKSFFAYISAGEVAESAQYYTEAVQAGIPFISENPYWASKVVDLASPLWTPFVVNHLARPAVDQGYDGFFLDTMDSYYLADASLRAAQEAGLVAMVKGLKAAYPSKKIIINRGFPVFDQLKDTVDGMLVEGLFYGYPGEKHSQDDIDWVLAQVAPVKAAGVPVYIVDYVPDGQVALARQVAKQISQMGFIPMVTGPSLNGSNLAPEPQAKIDQVNFKNGRPRVRFIALAGKTYDVECRDLLNAGAWSRVATVGPQSNIGPVEVEDATAGRAGSRVYRLVVQDGQ